MTDLPQGMWGYVLFRRDKIGNGAKLFKKGSICMPNNKNVDEIQLHHMLLQ